MNQEKTLGLVIPTLGERAGYLIECLRSIRTNPNVHVCVVVPQDKLGPWIIDSGLVDQVCIDRGMGLAAAINEGIKSLPTNLNYVSWLGDDDTLLPEALTCIERHFAPGVVAVYGNCNFMDDKSKVFWNFQTNQSAVRTLSWGPNRIPQPGSFYLRAALRQIGYLNEKLNWAFDQDMFLRLRDLGRIVYVDQTFANFRWHHDSLSSGGRIHSLKEASLVRLMHAPRALYVPALLREWIHVRIATSIKSSIDRKHEK